MLYRKLCVLFWPVAPAIVLLLSGVGNIVAQTTVPGAPRFSVHLTPPGVADSYGEPSIGVNWKSEKTFSNLTVAGGKNNIPNGGTELMYGGLSATVLRATFNDCSSPASVLWEQKPVLLASTPRAAGDPILFTDHDTGRTLVSQLEGLTPAGSTTDITDDDAETFTPSEGSGLPSDVDHQTIGGGRFAPPLTGSDPAYPNAIYYASQAIADARISLSLDGGRTFGPGVPMYTIAQCDGLHGHIKVSPLDGTVYVPNKGCGGPAPLLLGNEQASAVVSEDNGVTWAVRPIPHPTVPGHENDNLTKGDDDPSIGVGTDGTVYLGYQSLDGHPRIAVSQDKGKTWSQPYDVGAVVVNGGPVLNTTFPAVTAGDGDRAAFAFFGSETGGDNYNCGQGSECTDANGNPNNFAGVWYLYVAVTYDRGKTWTTQNVTPGDPIQRGGICGGGTCRNLLDFFDIQVDKEGRIVVGYDDGCISAACINGGANDFTAKAGIARQSGGKRLFAKFDPAEPVLPGAPVLSGTQDAANTKVTLTWSVPDNGGAVVISYNVYRGTSETGPFTLIASVQEPTFTDTTYDKTAKNFYHVTAVNSIGEGPFCQNISPIVAALPPNPCTLPGVLVNDDTTPTGGDNDGGANTPPDPRVNIRKLFVAEPFAGTGVNKLVFTLQVSPSTAGSAPPDSQWYIVWQRLKPDADFDRYYVAMVTDQNGTPSFEYGKFGVPLDPTNPNPNANTPVKIGNADKGTYNVATGQIVIELATSKAENIAAGQALSKINVRTYFAKPNGVGPRSQNIASDITGDSTYTLAGNAFCAVNQPPTARLLAAPMQGPAPLTVNFDASASTDPDTGGSVVSYTFSFGDGSPNVTQPTPKISHVYTHGGAFTATLTVADNKGAVSLNTDSVQIQTEATLLNLSTRMRVQTGDNVLIGGLIITGNESKKTIIRGLGPSLNTNGVPLLGTIQDPVLDLYDSNRVLIATNDNWKDSQQQEIEATGIPPQNDRESAIVRILAPGAYTAIVRDKNGGSGIGMVELYDINLPANSQMANLSTRGFVESGDNVMIGGFIAGATNALPANVLVRAIGPSLAQYGVAQPLQDPTLELYDRNGTLLASDDNWTDSQQADIAATGIAPSDPRESAILKMLEPGGYTAVVRGKDNSTGVGLVEVYRVK